MRRKHARTLAQVYAQPTSGTVRWSDIEALFVSLGATVKERAGSRVAIVWNGQVHIFHRPHPSPETDKGAVASVRRVLNDNGVKP